MRTDDQGSGTRPQFVLRGTVQDILPGGRLGASGGRARLQDHGSDSELPGLLQRIFGKEKLPEEVAAVECDQNHPEELCRVPQAEELAMVETVHQGKIPDFENTKLLSF